METNLDFTRLSLMIATLLNRELTDEELNSIYLLTMYNFETLQMRKIFNSIHRGDRYVIDISF